jgi:YidC/Oxa1 family membrane protein insertase
MFPEELNNASVVEELNNYKTENSTYKEVYYINEKRPDLLNTNFLGLDLAQVPNSNMKDLTMWIIPILSALTTYLTSKLTMKQNQVNNKEVKNEAAEQTMAMSKNMMMFMPIMTGYIAFIVPLGMGLYWLTNNIVSIGVQYCVNKTVNKKEEVITEK